jgi:hypothetical protein
MKKSEIYHLAQIAVVTTATICPEGKLAILNVLMDEEKLALCWEEQEERTAVRVNEQI